MFDDYMVRNRETSSYYFFVVPTVMERVLGILADEPAAAAAIDQYITSLLTAEENAELLRLLNKLRAGLE